MELSKDKPDLHDSPAITEVARPRTRLPFINTASVYLPERSLLAAVDYSDLKRDAALFLIDVNTLQHEKHPLPAGTNCGHRCLGRGGGATLYLASTNGALNTFDLESRTFEKRATLFDQTTFLYGLYVAPSSGRVYVGNYPEAYILEYDPATGGVRRFETLPRDGLGLYTADFIELPDGKLLALTTGGNPGITLFDPGTGRCRIVYRGDPAGESRGTFEGFLGGDWILVNFMNRVRRFNWRTLTFGEDLIADFPEHIMRMTPVGDDYYFCGHQTRRLYRWCQGAVSVVHEGLPGLNSVVNLHHLGDSEFAGMGDNGLFARFNLDLDELRSCQVENESDRGMGIQFLYKIPDEERVIGAHFINSQMFTIDLAADTATPSRNKVVTNPGQVNCGTALDGRFYLGSYVGAVLSSYDWRKPFVAGENPCRVGQIGDEQYRPMDMVNDGRYVYVATFAEYGYLGGAISVFDPAARRLDTYRNFVPDQNPTGLYCDSTGPRLIGATTIKGDCDTCPPRAEQAVLFRWDTQRRCTVETVRPWTSDSFHIVSLSSGGLCLGFGAEAKARGDRYFLWDLKRGGHETRSWPVPGIFIGGLFMDEDTFYGASEHGLFVLDIRDNTYDMLTQTTRETGSYRPKCFVKVSDTEFLFDLEGVRIMKASISK